MVPRTKYGVSAQAAYLSCLDSVPGTVFFRRKKKCTITGTKPLDRTIHRFVTYRLQKGLTLKMAKKKTKSDIVRVNIPAKGSVEDIFRAMRKFFEAEVAKDGGKLHPDWYKNDPQNMPK